ncbi:ABC transporter permease [Dactylosporangium sucinum]|uniref:Peptide ABC transporter permease n=1 Tax=Dactylosporangium sucinum TaxID=1424081 RepID=A0A917TT40_9ACTN|nr:ABC transporter permease [Dactylosporangium sucinum]GGM35917.1 peptide ABC transporter permease [Dactylosporangium sucinum]
MIAFIIRRLLVSTVVLIGISVLLFVLLQLMPGDPAEMMIDPMSFSGDRDAAIALRRHQLGLDSSPPVQYAHWVAELLHGNLGFSFSSGQPVTEVMAERLGPTVSLMGTALLISLLVGIPMGVVAALRRNSAVDYGTTVVSLLAISVPSFFAALLGIYVFGLKLQWFPTSGMNSIGGGGFVDSLHHLVLPASILGFALAGPYVRYARAGMLEVLGQDYLTTARSKGLSRRRVIGRHALHNALIPLVTVVAIQIPTLFAGAVVVEQIFAWPGMGRMALDAVLARDYPVLLGFVMAVAILVLLCNLLADLAYALIDPRIRL